MLELKAGDCDDMVILLGALLQSVGHPVRLVLCGPDSRRPRLLSHIYLEVLHQDLWLPLDATMAHSMGWQPRIGPRMVVRLHSSSWHVATGIGGNVGASVPNWLESLTRAMQSEAVQPRDARVRSLWSLLRERGLLSRSRWLRELLLRIWRRGLIARPRPRTTSRLLIELRNLGLLSQSNGASTATTAIELLRPKRSRRRRSRRSSSDRMRVASRARPRG
jgi:hypothetical protein